MSCMISQSTPTTSNQAVAFQANARRLIYMFFFVPDSGGTKNKVTWVLGKESEGEELPARLQHRTWGS